MGTARNPSKRTTCVPCSERSAPRSTGARSLRHARTREKTWKPLRNNKPKQVENITILRYNGGYRQGIGQPKPPERKGQQCSKHSTNSWRTLHPAPNSSADWLKSSSSSSPRERTRSHSGSEPLYAACATAPIVHASSSAMRPTPIRDAFRRHGGPEGVPPTSGLFPCKPAESKEPHYE